MNHSSAVRNGQASCDLLYDINYLSWRHKAIFDAKLLTHILSKIAAGNEFINEERRFSIQPVAEEPYNAVRPLLPRSDQTFQGLPLVTEVCRSAGIARDFYGSRHELGLYARRDRPFQNRRFQ